MDRFIMANSRSKKDIMMSPVRMDFIFTLNSAFSDFLTIRMVNEEGLADCERMSKVF